MTIVINFFGSPGSGKSTAASKLYSFLKENGSNTELVTECIKQWAWEERTHINLDQFYFFAKQARKEYTLFGKVDFIITDSPVALSSYYGQEYIEMKDSMESMLNSYVNICNKKKVFFVNVFMNRSEKNKYNEKGRYHTETEADEISIKMKEFLKTRNLKFIDYKIFYANIYDESSLESMEKFLKSLI